MKIEGASDEIVSLCRRGAPYSEQETSRLMTAYAWSKVQSARWRYLNSESLDEPPPEFQQVIIVLAGGKLQAAQRHGTTYQNTIAPGVTVTWQAEQVIAWHYPSEWDPQSSWHNPGSGYRKPL